MRSIPPDGVSGPFYYQDVATGETKTFLRWAQSYTLYHQNDGTLVGYSRSSSGMPPITLRAIDTPPGAASGPDWPPVSSFNAESTQFDQLRTELRSKGLNLQPDKRIPESWVVLIEEDLPMGFAMQGLVSSDFYSGYDPDPYQQVVGGQGEAGVNQEGLGIVLTGNRQTAKTIAFKGASLEQQLVFFQTAVKTAQNFLNPVISYKNTGTTIGQSPMNNEGRPWQPGDLVNISRSSLDAGGFATAHVIRVYPTEVLVAWPNDADHSKSDYPHGWFSHEHKTDLIFIREDLKWLEAWKKIPPQFSSRYGAEEMSGDWFISSDRIPLYGATAERHQDSLMQGRSPPWSSNVLLPMGLSLRTTPKKRSTDLYGEMDEILLHIRRQEALAQLMGVSL